MFVERGIQLEQRLLAMTGTTTDPEQVRKLRADAEHISKMVAPIEAWASPTFVQDPMYTTHTLYPTLIARLREYIQLNPYMSIYAPGRGWFM